MGVGTGAHLGFTTEFEKKSNDWALGDIKPSLYLGPKVTLHHSLVLRFITYSVSLTLESF